MDFNLKFCYKQILFKSSSKQIDADLFLTHLFLKISFVSSADQNTVRIDLWFLKILFWNFILKSVIKKNYSKT